MSGERIAVVGGGMLGLTLALRLAQRGASVTVFEGAPDFGGLAAPWTLGDVVWDRHYHVTLLSDRTLRALLTELNLESTIEWREVGTSFYTDGRLHPMNNAFDFLRFPPLGIVDKVRLGLTILRAARISDPRALESESVESWLVRHSGRRTFEKIWLPLLRAKLGDRYVEASAAFIWAIIARLYGARRAGVGAERFGSVRGGYAAIVPRLIERLRDAGVELHANAPMASVHLASGALQLQSNSGTTREFDRVILTVAAPIAAAMAPDLTPDERARLAEKRFGGIVCASVLLDDPIAPSYVTNITDASIPFSAVIEMSHVVDRSAWNGRALLYLPKYVAPDDPLFDRSDEEIEDAFLGALARMFPAFDRAHVRAFRVSRVRNVFPIATLEYSSRLPPIETTMPGLYVLNSAHIVNGTLNVNETIDLVDRGLAAIDRATEPHA